MDMWLSVELDKGIGGIGGTGGTGSLPFLSLELKCFRLKLRGIFVEVRGFV
jgi:hypothetical protein